MSVDARVQRFRADGATNGTVYHLARQRHIGDTLDALARRGRVHWHWEYVINTAPDRGGKAQYVIKTADLVIVRRLSTKQAESHLVTYLGKLGITWTPVPHPGGIDHYVQMREAGGLSAGDVEFLVPNVLEAT